MMKMKSGYNVSRGGRVLCESSLLFILFKKTLTSSFDEIRALIQINNFASFQKNQM